MDNSIVSAALTYAQAGLSVIPVCGADHPDESKRKRPTVKWREFPNRIATPAEIHKPFRT